MEKLCPGNEDRADLLRRLSAIADEAATLAASRDRDDAFPDRELELLGEAGLLLAPFPAAVGGIGLGSIPGDGPLVLEVLRNIGTGSLSLGRLYEGHLNAVSLVVRYGTAANLALLHEEAVAGRLTGVWMAEEPPERSLALTGACMLQGGKVFCSGAGFVRRPLVGARVAGAEGPQMALPYLAPGERVSTARWRPLGMKATATGDVDFTGIRLSPEELVGKPNDYLRPPWFRGGAWRVLAVQLGGLDALFELYRTSLAARASPDAVQQARFGEAATSHETARLWVDHAATIADQTSLDPASVDAYVDLARGALEGAANAVMARLERAVGLRVLIAPNPMERIIRDLKTYLRQPGLDLSVTSAASFMIGGGALP